jgi:chromatin assembly factor 1 subunit B
MIDLSYKMVFAIGTLDSIFIYDTQSIYPRSVITNIHLQPLTDLAWKGSSILAASSSDGYITFAIFDKDELGRPEEPEKLPEKARSLYQTYLNVDMNKNVMQINNGNKLILI